MLKKIMIMLTMLLAGRAMTLAYLHRAGRGGPEDPPAAWLMPLIGDAAIGISALFVAWLIWKRQGLWVWTSVIVWNAVAIWDALSAFIISRTNPWPQFFMLELIGPTMFFMASAMHLLLIILMCQREVLDDFLGKTRSVTK